MFSCSENTVNPDPDVQPKPSPASNLQAASINATTIHISYDISASESNSLFKDYQLTWKEDGGPLAGDSKVVLKGTKPIEVTGLSEGKIYLFTLVARYTNDSVSSPVTVKWSPSTRFTETVNNAEIRVYETASDFGSGLQIFYEAEGGPRVRKVVNGKDWDFGIRTTDNKLIIGSATKLSYNFVAPQLPGPTQFFADKFYADSLNGVFDSQAMNAGAREAKYSEMTFDLTSETNPKNIVFYVRKPLASDATKYNYAKIMLKRPAGGGSFLQGSGTNRYFEFEISYQKGVNVPYAKTSKNNSSN
jgi:hypothetical protein